MANRTRSSLATVARGLDVDADVTERLRTARGKIGTGIAWITVQKWCDAGFLRRDDSAGPKAVRYLLTAAGVAAALEAKTRAAKTIAAKVQRTKRAKRRAADAAPKRAPRPKPAKSVTEKRTPAPPPASSFAPLGPGATPGYRRSTLSRGEPSGAQCSKCGASKVVEYMTDRGPVDRCPPCERAREKTA